MPIPDANYTLDPNATTATVFVTDGVDGTGGPVVSLAVDPAEVNEGETLTITLTADGDIPTDGLEVFITGDTIGALGDFITVDETTGIPAVTVEGLAGFPAPNEDGSGFIATLSDNTATISFTIFDDGPGEGAETFGFSLLDGENYDVGNGNVSITINDEDGATGGDSITFESGSDGAFSAGDIITDQIDGLTVSVAEDLEAMIFDSANPTGGDHDLASSDLGNILIISEDGDSADPDDNIRGGTLMFNWDGVVNIESIGLLDIEETGGKITLYDLDDTTVLTTIDIPSLGNNLYQSLDIGTAEVGRMDVMLAGSGAIAEIILGDREVVI